MVAKRAKHLTIILGVSVALTRQKAGAVKFMVVALPVKA